MRYTLTLLGLLLAGCAGMIEDSHQQFRKVTGGAIGCPGNEVTISDHAQFAWRADCRGRTFYCQGLEGVRCTEAVRPSK